MAAPTEKDEVVEVSISELRAKLPDLLARVAYGKKSFTILKHGRPYAVIQPVDDEDEGESELAGNAGGRGRRESVASG